MCSEEVIYQLTQIKSTMTAYCFSCLDLLVTEDDDYYTFVKHLQSCKSVFEAIASLRDEKLAKQSISKEEFLYEFNINKRMALQRLFLHPISNSMVVMLLRNLLNSVITLDDVYEKHILKPRLMMTRVV